MKTAICGIGICGGFGSGREAFEEALKQGKPKTETVSVRTAQGSFQGPAFLADTAPLERFVERKALRRLDHFSKMALLSAYLAWEDAGNPSWDRSKTGLIVASGYGPLRTTFAFLDSFIEAGDKFSSPTPFSHSVHNAALAQVSMSMGITGPGLTVSQFEMSVPSALLTAQAWLAEGRVDALLFGAVDEYSEVLGYSWYRFFGPWGGNIEPWKEERQTAVPGEGAVFFLLTNEDHGDRKGYGVVEKVCLGRDPYDPSRIPKEALVIVGADGHRRCGAFYHPLLNRDHPPLSYTPLVRQFPTGAAFDLAAAALIQRTGKVFKPPMGMEGETVCQAYDGRTICCLKTGPEGEWGEIFLGP